MGRKVWPIAAVMTALLAAGCGGSDGAEGPGGSPGVAEGGEERSATPDLDATFRFTAGTNASSIYDPHTSTNPFVNVFLYPAYDRLTDLADDGSIVPMLAESWEFSEDAKSLTFTLRPDVVFHDGTPFDAAAVKANIERAKTLPKSTVKPDLAAVESVEVVDDLTVKFNLSAPASSLPALLADRAGMMISPAAFGNADLDLKPVGAGPFKVDQHQPGNVISYNRFEDYWEPDAQKIARLEIFMQLDPETRLRALQSGQTDATTINPDQLPALERADSLEVGRGETTASYLLYLNKSRPELADPKVREAMSLAIDREGIAAALHAGECEPSSQPFPKSYWAGSPDVEVPEHDPEKAKALLAEAGYPDGFSMSTVVVNVPFYVAQAEAIQAQLAEVGIEMSVAPVEPAQLLSRFATEKTADAYFSQWPGATDPAKTAASLYLPGSFLNPGGYADQEIVQLAQKGLGLLGQDERQPVYQELSEQAADSDFHLIVCHPKNLYATTDQVYDFDPNLAASFDFRGVYMAEKS